LEDGYCGCCATLAQADFRHEQSRIAVLVLAISGDDDPVCPPADRQYTADAVTDGRHISVPGRHLCNLKSPAAFTAAIAGFCKTGG
jgi:3-oxoadipate enol-lactonase